VASPRILGDVRDRVDRALDVAVAGEDPGREADGPVGLEGADALDVGEPQIDVRDAFGATVFYIDETGNPVITTTPTKSTLPGFPVSSM